MKIFITRNIPDAGIKLLKNKNYEVVINPDERGLAGKELMNELKNGGYDGVICLLSDKIDDEILEAAGGQCKIFANYAVGFENIDVKSAKKRGVVVTNTPGVLTEAVAEHAIALMFAVARRVVEADKYTRAGRYTGWEPFLFLGNELKGKTLGIVGLGRIGSAVAGRAKLGLGMKIIYYDVKQSGDFEKEFGAEFKENLDDLLREADFITLHVPLLESTRHLINRERLNLVGPNSYLINTSRGGVIDEQALVEALRDKKIKGAALDVFEFEPKISRGLAELDNAVLTPHIASATEETRQSMSELAAKNIIAVLSGEKPLTPVS